VPLIGIGSGNVQFLWTTVHQNRLSTVTGYLLDTNVVSELVKAKPEPLAKAFIASCSLDDLYLTEITFAEIRLGIEK
jgi:hypothetical protein